MLTEEYYKKDMQNLLNESKPHKKFIRSFLYMVTHPKKCLKLLNFATKVIVYFNLKSE